MKTANFIFFIVLTALFTSYAKANNADLIDSPVVVANTFFKAYKVNGAKISPKGKSIAYTESTGKQSTITLLDTESFKKYSLLENKFNSATKIADYHWIDDQTIVVELHANGKGRILMAINLTFDNGVLTGIRHKHLLDNVYVQSPLPRVKNKFLVSRWSEGVSSVFKIDISGKSIEGQLRSKFKLNKRAPKAKNWLTSSTGALILAYGVDGDDNLNKVWLKSTKKNKWKQIWQGSDKDKFQPVLLSKDRKTLLVISNEKDNYSALYKYDLVNQQYLEKVYGVKNTDIDGAIVNIDKDEVIGVSFVRGGFTNYKYFNKLEGYLSKSLSDSVTESYPYVVDYSLDKSKLIVQTSDSTDPGTYHLFDVAQWELIKFASKAPWIKEYKLEASKVITSHSSDGQEIESYLTLPATSKTNKPPLIVLPHGGPIAVRDTLHFDPHVQFLATLGYAVLQPNYRGSSGYGKKFKQQGMQQWGRLIEDDIASAVNEVIDSGIVDKDKVCVYGISYGGYSALINAINRPNLYKCAASYAGVTDLPLLFNDLMLSESPKLKSLMKEIVGDPETEIETLIQFSPVYQAKELSIPVFLAQGDHDSRVDIEHFYRMKKLLEHYGKDFDFMVLKNEGHGFKYLKNIVSFYVELDSFIRESLNMELSLLSKLRKQSKQGDASAQNELGRLYELDKEIPRNYVKARDWYRKAAEQGLAVAQNNLGVLYDYGRGVKTDFIEARVWYEKAAEQGYAEAFLNLGYLYENGQGVEKNYPKAINLFEQAVEHGHTQALINIGFFHEKGRGVEQDYAKAIALFEQAIEKGHTAAWGRLGYLYENGFGVTKDYQKALECYAKDKRDWAKKKHAALLKKV